MPNAYIFTLHYIKTFYSGLRKSNFRDHYGHLYHRAKFHRPASTHIGEIRYITKNADKQRNTEHRNSKRYIASMPIGMNYTRNKKQINAPYSSITSKTILRSGKSIVLLL